MKYKYVVMNLGFEKATNELYSSKEDVQVGYVTPFKSKKEARKYIENHENFKRWSNEEHTVATLEPPFEHRWRIKLIILEVTDREYIDGLIFHTSVASVGHTE